MGFALFYGGLIRSLSGRKTVRLERFMSKPRLQMFVEASLAPEARLPAARPLTLTRNFGWVVAFCVGSLMTAPMVVGWVASMFLH
jgi:hypothetical protein